MLNSIRVLLKYTVIAYLFICLSMWCFQRTIMYAPARTIESPQTYGLQDFSVLTLQDEDGTHIQAWYHKAASNHPTLLFFHGNGGNLRFEIYLFKALAQYGFGVLAPDYRGYGASEGSPSETGIYQDARATIHYAENTLAIPKDEIILYGESLGTGVVVQMATELPAAAVVLQSPYTSIEVIAKMRYPWLPVHFLLEDRFDSLSKIAGIHMPLLWMHGGQDTIVPYSEGKTLFAAANSPKEAIYFPDKGHNDLDVPQRINALVDFCKKYNILKDKLSNL